MKRHVLVHSCISLLVGSISLIQLTVSASPSSVNDTFQEGKESLHGVLQKTRLEPPLRDDIKHIRFSPDGKYVLAQDDTGINVLTRSPFAALFRIETKRASEAQFTTDSQNVVFHNSNLRVEFWSVTEQKLKSAHDVTATGYCGQATLSSDGKTLACLEDGRNLVLLDVATSAQILRQDDFNTGPYEGMIVLFPGQLKSDDSLIRQVYMDFSPDGRYFAAGVRHLRQRGLLDKSPAVAVASQSPNPKGYGDDPNSISEGRPAYDVYRPGENAESSKAVAFDLTKRKQVSLGGPLKDLLAGGFTFVTPDRVAGIHRQDHTKSALVSFPGGEVINVLPLEKGRLDAPGRGNFLLIRPLKTFPVGVMNLKDGSLVMANKKAAIDIYEDVYVSERADGELGLYGIGKNDLREKVQLPQSPLTDVGTVAVSPDFNFLAISGRSRAAVWDLSKGERIFFLRSFEGAYYAEDGAFYVDFPKHESVERTIAILQTQQRQVVQGQPVETMEAARSEQYGQFLTIMRKLKAKISSKISGSIVVPIESVGRGEGQVNKNTSLEVRDVRTMKQMWLKTFLKETPNLWVDAPNETMVLGWSATDDVAKAEIKNDTRLSKQLSTMKVKDLIYLYQILDANTGQQRGSILFDTEKASLYVVYVVATNDSVVALTSENGVLVYSLASGEKKGQLPGKYATVNRDANRLCVVNKDVQLTIYDLATMQERDQFTFPSPVVIARFSKDGNRLFVLTQSQTTYVLDVSSSGSSEKS